MAEATVPQAPAPDTVVIRLSSNVERDYVERGVFPALRYQSAVEWSSDGVFFHVAFDEAESLLEDAQARWEFVTKGLKKSYSAHVLSLERAIKEAKNRRKIIEANEPSREYQCEWGEKWIGTKEQLLAMGICLSGPWPGEPGGGLRWAKTTDKRGYPVHITRYSAIWGRYRATIEIPRECRSAPYHESERREQVQHRERATPRRAHLTLVWSAA